MPDDTSRHDRLFLLSPDSLCGPCWRPAVDVYRDRDGWLVKFDLAGVSPQDVRVTLSGNRVTVAGARRDLAVQEGCQAWSMEISYSSFERSVDLPASVEGCEAHTESRDGMFLVWIRPIARKR